MVLGFLLGMLLGGLAGYAIAAIMFLVTRDDKED
jgi:hypothetical protein